MTSGGYGGSRGGGVSLAMRFAFFSAFLLLTGAVRAQVPVPIPPGAYRTAAAYRHRQPQPAGTNAFYPDKRGKLVVEVPRGTGKAKLRVAPDSLWGYVSGKGRTTRFYRGAEYELLHADTLSVYASTDGQLGGPQSGGVLGGSSAGSAAAATKYFFSRGLTGLIFPLTPRFLREMYAAGTPAFVAALDKLRFDQSLADRDRKTGLFRVTTLYREALR